jgi:GGDEF domain-containing protein
MRRLWGSVFQHIATNLMEPTASRDRRRPMLPVPPRRRRARPVADAPLDSLLPRSEDLTKGWLLALLEDAPLGEAPAILAAALTRDGPRLCTSVLRALADDTDLRRLEAGGALRALAARTGELAGATTPAAASRAVDALQAAIWSALRDELRGADADLLAALTERLTLVAELLRTAALDRGASPPGGREPAPTLHSAPPLAGEPGPALSDPARGSWPAGTGAAEPGEALWVGALEDEIRRSPGTSVSLLLAELEDAERVTAIHPPPPASATFSQFSSAVRSTVRRQDILVCESDARAWVIARDTSRQGALALGGRIAEAVKGTPPWQGVPLVASVGFAVLGEDGRTSAELIQAAEEARCAAAASGVDVRGVEPDPGV